MASLSSISVIVVTYNHEEYIRDCLESIANQDLPENISLRIIVNDDASQDETAEIVSNVIDFFQQPGRVDFDFQINANNIGMAHNLANALERVDSDSEWVAFCEGDDFWTHPRKLRRQLEVFVRDPNIDICFHDAMVTDANKNPLFRLSSRRNALQGRDSGFISFKSLIESPFRPWHNNTLLVRFSNLPPKEMWLYEYPTSEFPFVAALFASGRAYYLAECLSANRKNKGSVTATRGHTLAYYSQVNRMYNSLAVYIGKDYRSSIRKQKLSNLYFLLEYFSSQGLLHRLLFFIPMLLLTPRSPYTLRDQFWFLRQALRDNTAT